MLFTMSETIMVFFCFSLLVSASEKVVYHDVENGRYIYYPQGYPTGKDDVIFNSYDEVQAYFAEQKKKKEERERELIHNVLHQNQMPSHMHKRNQHRDDGHPHSPYPDQNNQQHSRHQRICPRQIPILFSDCSVQEDYVCTYAYEMCCGYMVASAEARCINKRWEVASINLNQCKNCNSKPRDDGQSCGFLVGVCKPHLECTIDTLKPSSTTGICVDANISQTICQRKFHEKSKKCGTKQDCYIPQCEHNGAFVSKQCNQSTGICWCVGPYGDEIFGTKTLPTLVHHRDPHDDYYHHDKSSKLNCPNTLCPEDCSIKKPSPICGSDGNTYLNQCELNRMSCLNPDSSLEKACSHACPCTKSDVSMSCVGRCYSYFDFLYDDPTYRQIGSGSQNPYQLIAQLHACRRNHGYQWCAPLYKCIQPLWEPCPTKKKKKNNVACYCDKGCRKRNDCCNDYSTYCSR